MCRASCETNAASGQRVGTPATPDRRWYRHQHDLSPFSQPHTRETRIPQPIASASVADKPGTGAHSVNTVSPFSWFFC